jgi:sulfocyanin
MLGRLILPAVLFTLLFIARAPAQEKHETPSWMQVDASAKLVKLDIIAGFNANNGALNFNGYYTGDMTVTVPLAWTVEITFHNHDGMLPHSLLVTKPYPLDQMPDLGSVNEVAIPRAYTVNPEQGIFAPKSDTLRFRATPAGRYYFFCGAPGHGKAGMWTRFAIDPSATAPYVTVAPGAETGRR